MISLVNHTEASEAAYRRAIATTKRYAARVLEAAEGCDDADDAATLQAIADALTADNGRRVAGIATRHLPTMSARVRKIAADMGHDADDATCPLMAAEGMTSADAMMSRVRNGRSDADMRGTTYRCPVCLAADVVRTLTRDGADARSAEERWNRKG